MTASSPAIEARSVSKSFATPVLKEVSVAFYSGEIHALLGMNGAGKSTLMRILAGVIAPDAGEIVVAGRPVVFRHPNDALEAGIAMAYQELDLAPQLSVAENLVLGNEPASAVGILRKRDERRRAHALLSDCGLEIEPNTSVRNLRTGERQLVAIAKAYGRARGVLILDEPTSALNTAEVERLFTLLRRLRDQGMAIIYISHRLEETRAICDRATVLRNGNIVYSQTGALRISDVVREMVGAESVSEALQRPVEDRASGTALMEVTNLSLAPAFENVSFTLHAGEVLGLAGLVGDGRGALADALFGLLQPGSGQVRLFVSSKPAAGPFKNTPEAVAQGLGFIPEDRSLAICPQLSSGFNATLAAFPRFTSWWRRRRDSERNLVTQTLSQAGVDPSLSRRLARQLSGGTQQKVLFGRWLSADSRVLILNEPTRGVDVSARLEIYRRIQEWLTQGVGVLLITSDLDELLHLSHRVLLMRRGRISGELSGRQITREAVLRGSAAE